MNDKCVLSCEENYENRTEGDEYVCKAKKCNDRTPFSNGSCSVKEDLVEENAVKCYLYREVDEGRDTCTSECPNDYLQVYQFFFNLFCLSSINFC
jgi:hypothetical protein